MDSDPDEPDMELEPLHLDEFPAFTPRAGPLLLVILDGWGVGKDYPGNAVLRAETPVIDGLRAECEDRGLYTELKAHGPAVGMPSDKDMGNSEVAHNTIGAGRAFAQGAKLVNQAIADGTVFETEVWHELISPVAEGDATLHFIGLLSDGNVHSHIQQLLGLIDEAVAEGAKRIRLHALLDGRDVPARSALKYIQMVEDKFATMAEEHGADCQIASGGGRMRVTMDRYNSDWQVVKRGWDAHVRGVPEQFEGYPGYFSSAREAIETARAVKPEIDDQYNPSFVIVDADGHPVGRMHEGDSVIFFNFRGDRAIQISRAFEEDDFSAFDREERPAVTYAGLLEYDGDEHIPAKYLVPPPSIDRTITQYLCSMEVPQYAIAETHKYGHVTYFWNGNFQGYICEDYERYVEIKSDPSERIAKEPAMKAAEVTDALIAALKSGKYDFLRVNYANGDMVGHTGVLEAAIETAGVVDECVGRLLEAIDDVNGILLLTADHGNLDEMIDTDGEAKTSHTLNPVPFHVYDGSYVGEYHVDTSAIEVPAIYNIAATILNLMGYAAPPEFEASLLKFE